jgi:hypothetical protein
LFVPLFERGVLVLNNFEAFVAAFAEAFKDHDKDRSATTKKDHALHLYMYWTSFYWHAILIRRKRSL